ncbi:hypothetical protein A2160_05990 [Candidatus Beckwithbacteria bacterium RBG_13_42_9]|uniref:Type II secretion system protein GspG C-terminal domain-containing protein n=1 Tax=Candidatus Beckwithbacteria bacterium RBG_13_42_9 TaxID=1797457 RepID=A0A1F5E5B5_9BACT|nr:MAG: hypothetical protein A2160_05990 [Candidatus Beckwithbacteria bacterium RBG_13_42_9]
MLKIYNRDMELSAVSLQLSVYSYQFTVISKKTWALLTQKSKNCLLFTENCIHQRRTSLWLELRSGFTFVELLVVITIIALLSAIGLANYRTVSQKTRDSKRKSDLEQIRAALEMYRSDQGQYPTITDLPASFLTSCTGTLTSGAKTYMDPIPCDPKNTGSYQYTYTPGAVPPLSYQLETTMEVDTSGGTCGSGLSYCVKQP